jgi:hypothetical protein
MDLQRLARAQGPWLHLLVAEPSDACNALWALERGAPVPLAARVVRGRKAPTSAALFDECAAALQFPYYFGENWDALRDCLADLAWLRVEAVVLCVADAVHLLDKAPPDEARRLVQVLEETVRHWHQPAKPHKPRPFHVVLHATPREEGALLRRWQALTPFLDHLP